MRRFAIAGAAVAVLLLASAAVAAASGWSIEHTPNPTGGSNSDLSGVSCPSTRACTAVGGYNKGTTFVALAERWNGTKWSIKHTPKPTGSSNSALSGVSCTSARACIAVGSYNNGTTLVALAERWNGTKWSIQHTPKPTGGSNIGLRGVSCVSARACMAVGSYNNGTTSVALAERWNGTKWASQHPRNPTGRRRPTHNDGWW